MNDGDGRIALVTGANKGIGLAVVRSLAARGIHVLLGSRDLGRGRVAVADMAGAGLFAEVLVLDITDDASVLDAADVIDRRFGHLDILVNNAAVKLETHPSPPSSADLTVVRATYETNVFGTMSVMHAMVPLLLRSPAPRVVNVSSGLGSLTMATTRGMVYRHRPMLGYNTSKAALNSMTIQFANQLRHTAIKINAVDPGYTRTDMTDNDAARTPEEAARPIVEMCLIDADGPTGTYSDESGPLPW